LRPLRNGIGYFALQAGVPVVPVAVTGADRLIPLRPIEVSIGPPVLPDLPAWWELSRRVAAMVDNVRNAISTALGRRRP
jgi:1-acyl-sn-glycerol-3-phosphate acyltransferase